MIAARQTFLGRGGGAKLPYDAEVEYLESTGTQYIDLPITAGQCYGFELQVTDVATVAYNVYVGNGTSNDFCVGVNNGNINNSYIRIRTSVTFVYNTGATKRFTATNGIITVNSANVGTYDASLPLGNNNNAMGMFAYSHGGVKSICRIMSYKLYGANVELLLDVIPVRFTNELGQSEGAMYDRVSGQLFRNAGTGAFTYGGDVYSVPVETSQYVQDGLVAMWDGKENAGVGVHSPNATSWVDLVGTRNATLSGSYSWGTNYWDVQSVSGQGLAIWGGDNLPSSQTVEVCIYPSANSLYGRIMAEGQGIPSPNIHVSEHYIRLYGYGIDSLYDIGGDFTIYAPHLHTIVHPSGGPMVYHVDGEAKWTNNTSQDSTGSTYGYFANRSSLDRGLDAKYYCVRIYNRALTAAEIAANYAVDKQRFNLP